jgi:hypothetical protein
MPISYSKYKFNDLDALNILMEREKLFSESITPFNPSELLMQILNFN